MPLAVGGPLLEVLPFLPLFSFLRLLLVWMEWVLSAPLLPILQILLSLAGRWWWALSLWGGSMLPERLPIFLPESLPVMRQVIRLFLPVIWL